MKYCDYPEYSYSYENHEEWLVKARSAKKALDYYIDMNSINKKKPSTKLCRIVAETRQHYRVEEDIDEEDMYQFIPSLKGVVYYQITAEAVEIMRKEGILDD